MRRNTVATTALLIAVTIVAVGCAPWATYPPVEHTSKLVNPQFEPIPKLMAESLRYVHEEYGTVEQPVFNLPEGTPASVYRVVQARVDQARPMTAEDERAYHVTTVRTRGPEAETDVIIPRADGLHELVTVRFKQRFGKGYQVDGARTWRVRVTAPPPQFPDSDAGQQTERANVDSKAEPAAE